MGFPGAKVGDLDIVGLPEENTADDADKIVIYDDSDGSNKSMTRANFLAGISGAGESIYGK